MIFNKGIWLPDNETEKAFTKNYEINYSDGQTTVMNEFSMRRLIRSGIIVVLVY